MIIAITQMCYWKVSADIGQSLHTSTTVEGEKLSDNASPHTPINLVNQN